MAAAVAERENPTSRRIRVVVADDSAVMRRVITHILERDDDIEVVGTARDGAEAIELTRTLQPDAVTLDVNMPRMDGLRALEVIMGRHPTPVVLLSAFARPGSQVGIQALAYGAVHVVHKPSEFGIALDLDQQAAEIRHKVRAASRVRVVRNATYGIGSARRLVSVSSPSTLAASPQTVREGMQIIAIGASTGGTEVFSQVLRDLPKELPACVLIVQHCPPGYTESWAAALDTSCSVSVLEAKHGDFLRPGKVFIAPGGHHMEVRGEQIQLVAGPRVKDHRPSVNVLFDSLRPVASRVIATLFSGMGDDGVAAMMRLHTAGAATIAQSASGCSVWGMPGAAVRAGCVDDQVTPAGFVPKVLQLLESRNPCAGSGGISVGSIS